MANGVIAAPGTPGLWQQDTTFDVQGIQIGDDGTIWLYTKQYDPTAQDGKGGYVWNQTALGNPEDPGYDWNNVATNTNIPVALLRQQYETAKFQKSQQDAQKRAQGQWHYDSISPYTGAITVKNGANQTQTIPLDQVLAPDFATKFPGVDVADIQRNVQSVNQQNWLDYGFTAPGTSNYRSYKYFSLTPGIGQKPPPGSDPGDWNPGPTPRPGPVIPGANPNPTPDPGRGWGYDPTLGTPNPSPGGHGTGAAAPPVAPPPPGAVPPPAALPVPAYQPPISATPPAPLPTPNPAATPPIVPTLPGQQPVRR